MKFSKWISFFMLNLFLVIGCFGGEEGEKVDGAEGATPFGIAYGMENNKHLFKNSFPKSLDIDMQNNIQCTALRYAVVMGWKWTVKKLLEFGADCKIRNYEGRNALHDAAFSGRDAAGSIVKILVKACKKANICIDELDNEGMTPLHLAAQGKSNLAIWHLVRGGANINAKDKNGRTPLHLAAQKGRVRQACLLLLLGADRMIEDYEGFKASDKCGVDLDRILRLLERNCLTRFWARFFDIPHIFVKKWIKVFKREWENAGIRNELREIETNGLCL